MTWCGTKFHRAIGCEFAAAALAAASSAATAAAAASAAACAANACASSASCAAFATSAAISSALNSTYSSGATTVVVPANTTNSIVPSLAKLARGRVNSPVVLSNAKISRIRVVAVDSAVSLRTSRGASPPHLVKFATTE